MEDIQVMRNGSFYVVVLGGDEYKISIKKVEEIARDWGIEAEEVAQIRAILRVAEDGEEKKSYMTFKKFTEGYKKILELMQPEELICYMEDKPGYILLYPEKLLEQIKREKEI